MTNMNSYLSLTFQVTEAFSTNQTEKQDSLSTNWVKDEKV